MDTLRWLHLSDVHFSDGESYEIKRMRDSIIDKMKEVFEKNKVDFVVLSGDLAYQGGAVKDQGAAGPGSFRSGSSGRLQF